MLLCTILITRSISTSCEPGQTEETPKSTSKTNRLAKPLATFQPNNNNNINITLNNKYKQNSNPNSIKINNIKLNNLNYILLIIIYLILIFNNTQTKNKITPTPFCNTINISTVILIPNSNTKNMNNNLTTTVLNNKNNKLTHILVSTNKNMKIRILNRKITTQLPHLHLLNNKSFIYIYKLYNAIIIQPKGKTKQLINNNKTVEIKNNFTKTPQLHINKSKNMDIPKNNNKNNNIVYIIFSNKIPHNIIHSQLIKNQTKISLIYLKGRTQIIPNNKITIYDIETTDSKPSFKRIYNTNVQKPNKSEDNKAL